MSVCFGDAEDPSQRDCTEIHNKGHLKDVDNDGRVDLVLHYETNQSGIDPEDALACLNGKFGGGMTFEGCASIRLKL